jgi:putative membrane protein
MMWDNNNMDGWGFQMMGWWGVVVMLILIVAVAMIVFRSKFGSSSGTESPLDILKRRYAKGEIDLAEFTRRKLEIEGV